MTSHTEVTAQKGAHPQSTGREQELSRQTAHSEVPLHPPVDIFEDVDSLTLIADLPGVSKDRLDVRVERDALVVEGRLEIALAENMQPVYADVRSTHYERRFALSDELETEQIEASLKDGVLTVRIPKRAETKPRRIEIRTP